MTRNIRFCVISLFPDMFAAFCEQGVIGRAISAGLIAVDVINPRDFALDKHRTVDDRPYGGGPGMLMKVQPLADAIYAAKQKLQRDARVVYLSPQGKLLRQDTVQEYCQYSDIILVAGRYEGIDERVIATLIDEELSIGDYVLSGGELPAMVLMDAISRFVPGVLGHDSSAYEDSFAAGLLDCPHYTRPEQYQGLTVPSVLLSGDHEKIRQWRLSQAIQRTIERRPDLLNDLALTEEQQALVKQYNQS